ncbi:MAG: cob(I)yrinic acid a,c-diamide adenosyltransferase [Candidatus Gottesmanbacteria bacterium]|nr:cob(I)yrinic acid a,c-diamide adenosyltransferase [Candidatus Gottesmanbacteria bacterium]
MSIYTRTGDTGSTSLFGGKRVLKCEELVEVYGSLDELNSWIGLIAAEFSVPDVSQFLQLIQSDVFTIGSTLAGWPARNALPEAAASLQAGTHSVAGGKGHLADLEPRTKEMETRIDMMEKDLMPIRNFILPGGAAIGARTHIARAICRRVERQTVALSQKQSIDPVIIKYLNRLSDLFFVLARFINKQENVEEVVWRGTKKSDQ